MDEWRRSRQRDKGAECGVREFTGWKLLHQEELSEKPVIDAHRCIGATTIHLYVIVAPGRESFKTPPLSLRTYGSGLERLNAFRPLG